MIPSMVLYATDDESTFTENPPIFRKYCIPLEDSIA